MVRKKLFIFDLDGTLVDAYKAIQDSLNFTRAQFDCPPVSYREVKRKVGRGDKVFIHTFFPRDNIQKALSIYRRHHKKSLLKFSRALPWAKRLLYSLKRRKKLIAVASNRPQLYTNIIVKRLDMLKHIDYVLCADKARSHKPDPRILYTVLKKFNVSKEESVFIGDMDVDMETARRARIDAVFTKGGSSTLQEIKKYKNKKVISSLREILDLYV